MEGCRKGRRLAALLACFLVLACGVAACGGEPAREERQGAARVHEETTRARGERAEKETAEGPRLRQRATYYGDEFAGSPTASGEPYDPRGLTAAHKTLPFGAVLEVCYSGCARVTVNDRNPYSEADLDLSRAAADRIGLTPAGVGVVRAEVVRRGPSGAEGTNAGP